MQKKRNLMTLVKTTLIGGLFFLVPFGVLLLIAQELVDLAMLVAGPIADLFPTSDTFGIILSHIIAWLLILIACFVAGLLARVSVVAGISDRADETLASIVPGYALIKAKISGIVAKSDTPSDLRPVMVRFGAALQYGFETNRDPERNLVTVFLPDAPNPESGRVMVFPAEDVETSDYPALSILNSLRYYGREV